MRSLCLIGGFLILCPQQGKTDELAGVVMPAEVDVAGRKLLLNGMGVREGGIDRLKVYVAGLYLEERTRNHRKVLRSKTKIRLVLRFLMAVQQKSILDAWEQGFVRNAGDRIAALRERIDRLKGWMAPVSAGESYEFNYLPDQGLEVYVKGQRQGIIPGEDFAFAFFSIWIGNPPLDYKLRNALLGRSS